MRSMPSPTMHFGVAAAAWAAALGDPTSSSPVQERVVPVPPKAVRLVVSSADRVAIYPDKRWKLSGDGTSVSPYCWVWVPARGTSSFPAPARTRPNRQLALSLFGMRPASGSTHA